MLKELVYVKGGNGEWRTRNFGVKPYEEFKPFWKFGDRQAWDGLDVSIRTIIEDTAGLYENVPFPMLKATDYMEYYRSGSRAAYEIPYFKRRHALAALTLGYCLHPRADILDQIIDGIWCICEESSWAVPAHNFIYEPEAVNGERTLPDDTLPVLDIFAGETGMLLSMCRYLLKEELDRVEPLAARRIASEVKRRITGPFLTRYDYWWMGYSDRRDINNWGPWCVMNCIISLLFVETDPDLRKRGIVRAMDMMDYYLQGIGQDGGCDEGATYWGRACGMLLEGLSLIHDATEGAISAYGEEKLVNFTDYIRKMYIGNGYVVNFADGSARCNPAAEIIYTAGLHMENTRLMEFGSYCFTEQLSRGEFPVLSLSRAMASVCRSQEMTALSQTAAFEPEEYVESLEIMTARQSHKPDQGFFVCVKGGGNGDSHNHNDVGSLICFYDGRPVLVDAGVEEYTKESFGPGRYEIWTMQSGYHNLPEIDGLMQKEGGAYRALEAAHTFDGNTSSFTCLLHKAYEGLKEDLRYRRTVTLNREREAVCLEDHLSSDSEIPVKLHFMTPCRLTEVPEGILFDAGEKRVIMRFDTAEYETAVETLPLTDKKLTASWGTCLYRLVLKTRGKESRFCFCITEYDSL